MIRLPLFLNNILLMPFLEKGRDYSGGDCWAVPYLAYRDILGVELPSFVEEYTDTGFSSSSRKELNELIKRSKLSWFCVPEGDKLQPLDVVLFNLGGQPIHCGLMVDSKSFIHCERKIGVVVERIKDIKWIKRVEGVYRLCEN